MMAYVSRGRAGCGSIRRMAVRLVSGWNAVSQSIQRKLEEFPIVTAKVGAIVEQIWSNIEHRGVAASRPEAGSVHGGADGCDRVDAHHGERARSAPGQSELRGADGRAH